MSYSEYLTILGGEREKMTTNKMIKHIAAILVHNTRRNTRKNNELVIRFLQNQQLLLYSMEYISFITFKEVEWIPKAPLLKPYTRGSLT